jgi:3-deoxy-D-manno-octulosonic-acid transferase
VIRPGALSLYRAATGLLEPIAPVLLASRARKGKEDPARIAERLGRAETVRPDGPLVWLHGASVGESLSILPLVERLRAERPEVTVLVTSGTTTSAALLAKRLPAGAIHQYIPVDAPDAARRFIARWKPSLAVFVESELWPNLLLEAKAAGARLALVSAKLSDRSFASWQRRPDAARQILSGFDLILAQDARAHERFEALGGQVAGEADLKFGAAPLPVDETELAKQRSIFAGKPILVAASTHPGEDEIVLAAYEALGEERPHLIIVPRHIERGPAIAEVARKLGLPARLRSSGGDEQASVLIADTLGELGLWYRLADLALICGSLLPGIGGHNPLEAARVSCPFARGAYVENWESAYEALAEAGCWSRIEGPPLDYALQESLGMLGELRERAGRARTYVKARDAEARAGLSRILELVP